jgi:hypothetical protein
MPSNGIRAYGDLRLHATWASRDMGFTRHGLHATWASRDMGLMGLHA